MKLVDYLDAVRVTGLVAEDYVRMQKHPTEELWIFNYTNKTQYEHNWTLETTRCRGLIADNDYIVARPFEKFFNWGEADRDYISNSGPIRVTDKMDGSLGILYQEPSTGRLAIATRGSFTSDQAVHATQVLRDRYEDFAPVVGVTYLFEIVYPENRIVVDYGDLDDLVLLDVIDNEEGDSVLGIYGITWPGPVVEHFDYQTIEDVIGSEPRDGKEGFVVYFQNNGSRMKVKYEEYVRLHRLITGVSSKTIWEILASGGSVDEITDRVPDEYFEWVKETVADLKSRFKSIDTSIWQAYSNIMQFIPDSIFQSEVRERRKWFAEQVRRYAYHDWNGLLFLLYDDKNPDAAIWKLIKPKYTKPYWTQTEEAA